MANTHLWIEAPAEAAGQLELSAALEVQGSPPQRLWYRFPIQDRPFLTEGHDPFVLGTIFAAMHAGGDLVVHGEVSPTLLRNLDEFQAAWASWRPDEYSRIEIRADAEREQPPASGEPAAISAFSGGVDSCFTVWRHRTGRCGRQRRNLEAGLLVHGLDIPLEQGDVFESAVASGKVMLDSLGVKLLRMATNFKQVGGDWEDVFLAGIASCLMWYQKQYGIGLIGSSQPYTSLSLPWGSNPISDRMLSNGSMEFIHDGAAYIRTEKVREIAQWPEVLQHLRVCWAGDRLDRNCGRCEKCIRTVLNFRAVGLPRPPCLPYDVSDRQIRNLHGMHEALLGEFVHILSTAKKGGITASWVAALDDCVRRNRRTLARGETVWFRARRRLRKTWRSLRKA